MSERTSKHFRAEARSAHAEKQDVFEAVAANLFRERGQIVAIRQQALGNREPSECVLDDLLVFRFALPDRRIAAPDTVDGLRSFERVKRVVQGDLMFDASENLRISGSRELILFHVDLQPFAGLEA